DVEESHAAFFEGAHDPGLHDHGLDDDDEGAHVIVRTPEQEARRAKFVRVVAVAVALAAGLGGFALVRGQASKNDRPAAARSFDATPSLAAQTRDTEALPEIAPQPTASPASPEPAAVEPA